MFAHSTTAFRLVALSSWALLGWQFEKSGEDRIATLMDETRAGWAKFDGNAAMVWNFDCNSLDS